MADENTTRAANIASHFLIPELADIAAPLFNAAIARCQRERGHARVTGRDLMRFGNMLHESTPTDTASDRLQAAVTLPAEPGHPDDPEREFAQQADTEEERALPDADAARPFLNLAGRR